MVDACQSIHSHAGLSVKPDDLQKGLFRQKPVDTSLGRWPTRLFWNASQYFLRHVLDHPNSCGTINRGSIFWIHGTMQWHLRRRYLDPPKKQLKNTEPRKGDLTSCSMVELESFFLGGGVDILLGVNSARLRIWMSIYRAISSPIKSQGFQQPKYVSLNQCPSLNCAREKWFLIKENRHRTSEFLVGSLFCGCHVAYSLMLKCLFMLGIPSHLKHSRSFVFVSEAVKLVGVCVQQT